MKLLVINGPNLNLLGKRQPELYGSEGFDSYFEKLKVKYQGITLSYFQSNVEGELINELQKADGQFDGIIINAGGYTHTSVALSDCIAAIECRVIEVHITNIYAREEYRTKSLLSKNCEGVICGFGLHSYDLAVEAFLHQK